MKRAAALLLCLSLTLAPALAAGHPDLPETHWAYAPMERACALGVLTGQPDGALQPDAPLTWGQYLTMLGRTFYPDALAAQAAEGGHWAAPALLAARSEGVLPEGDFLTVGPGTLDAPIPRQDAAVLLSRVLPGLDGPGEDAAFPDWDALPETHREAVAAVSRLGIVGGMPDGSFSGGAALTRAQGTVMLLRLLDLNAPQEPAPVAPAPAPLSAEETRQAALVQLEAGTLTWEQYNQMDFWLSLQGENARKLTLLYGDPGRRRFDSRAEAEAAMAEITVPVWQLNAETGEKTASTLTVTVHAALADDLSAIFQEIFDDPEQFPIKNLGGFRWTDGAKGEHNCGTAVDLNWEENYQIYDGGRVGAGNYWKPGEDLWSIPSDGSVVRIFKAHGYGWGGDAWPGSKDYMHFSYLGK